MSFQLPGNNNPSAGGFSFGAPNTTAQAVAPKSTGFTFGATGGGDAGAKPLGFGFGTTTSSVTSTVNTPATSSAIGATNFGLGGATTTAFTFGANTAANASNATTTQSVAPSATIQPTATGFGFGTTPAVTTTAATITTTASSTTSASATSAAPLTTAFSAFATPATTTSTSASSGTATTTATSLLTAPVTGTSVATSGFASLTTATKTTDSTAMPPSTSQLTYSQLEEHINKWTLELEEQEKVFTDQATQINAWDKVLISNNQKILDLNDAVQKVKSDQQTLEQELEFIATQHKELEESIGPLQKEFLKIPQVDVERSQTYLMVENLDTQLKQMSEDLKEIIDNLNESNKCQDNSDPIIQIGKILNAHMSSLQWIEQSTSSIGTKLEDITKMHETFKRDSERSFRSAYYN